MRLTAHERDTIRASVLKRFGADSRVWLFGSRVDDAARGGDIDLLVEPLATPEDGFRQSLALQTDFQLALDDPKIDIVLYDPARPEPPIVRLARQTGVEL